MLFGRRKKESSNHRSAIPPHPGPDDDGITRVIPKEIWEGRNGDFLRELGFSPDDDHNIIKTAADYQRIFDAKHEEQKAFVAKYNSNARENAAVVPFSMMPWTMWQTPYAEFLMSTLELYPTEPWNMLLLPEDDQGGLALGLPKHPKCYVDGYEAGALDCVENIHQELMNERQRLEPAIMAHETGALGEFSDAVGRARTKIISSAHTLASIMLGNETYDRHQELFGRMLNHPDVRADKNNAIELNYDAQPDLIIPLEFYENPVLKNLMDRVSFHPNMKGNLVWFYTDPATAAALYHSEENVRQIFVNAGFSFRAHNGVWRTEQDKFAHGELMKIVEYMNDKALDDEQLKRAFFQVLMFLDKCTKEFLDGETPPVNHSGQKFDVDKALAGFASA